MNHHIIGNRLVVDIHIRQQHIIPYLCFVMNVGNLQINIFTAYRLLGQHAVIAGNALLCDTAVDPVIPAKMAVIPDFFSHQPHNFFCGSKMDKFRRSQTQKLHAVGMERLPHSPPAYRKFF